MADNRVLWLTNLAPPYRRAIWGELTPEYHLTIALTGRDEAQRVWSTSNEPGEQFTITPNARNLRSWRDTWTVVRRSDLLVLGGWHQPEYLVALLLNRRRVPTLAFYESTAQTHRFRAGPVAWVRAAFLRSVDAVLAVGTDSRDALVSMGVAPDQIVVGPQVIDGAFFHTATAAARAARTPRAGHHLVFVGQLVARKNVEVALRAWATRRRPGDRFTIVGTGVTRERLVQVARELGVTDDVTFEDYRERDSLAELYADANTLVLPSTKEVWGMVANEALSAGLHLVLSDRSGAVPALGRMRGVFVCAPTVDGVGDALDSSRDAWTGPITQPEILDFSPEFFGRRTAEALELARSISSTRRPRRVRRSTEPVPTPTSSESLLP